jgi:hypothetical protein
MRREGIARLSRFAERGFHHDGYWREGTLSSHLKIVDQLDGWIVRLLDRLPAAETFVSQAREAGAAALSDSPTPEILRASWPAPTRAVTSRAPRLLGGVGIARLAVGHGDDALDLELRSLDASGPDRIQRQALRVAVGGRTLLGDLDERPGLASGWNLATASHNTVVVDGLNQRESLARARESAPGGDFLYFAADPDFQVVTLDDPRAYPNSTTRYRQTLIAVSGARSRYAVSVFEIHGGLQHDQLFHAATGTGARWDAPAVADHANGRLLAPGLTLVNSSDPQRGRWFVQAYGEIAVQAQGPLSRPTTATLVVGDGQSPIGARLHLLGDFPSAGITATSPGPSLSGENEQRRATLLIRRRSADGATLKTRFVTVIEPIGASIAPLRRVGRVASTPGAITILVESDEGAEHLVVNLKPGTATTVALADGRNLTTDGIAVRVGPAGLTLAGGTFAESGARRVEHSQAVGSITRSVRAPEDSTRGWFETNSPIGNPEALAGRVMTVRHGDGVARAWTLTQVENRPEGARLHVREDPGFVLNAPEEAARYIRFPADTHPGPHSFRIGRITH